MTDATAPKVADLVRQHLPQIIEFCTGTDPNELSNLLDAEYTRQTFKEYRPFFKTLEDIERDGDHRRYWGDIHLLT